MSTKEQRKKWREAKRKERKNPEKRKLYAQQQAKYRKKMRELGIYQYYRGNRTAQTRRWVAKNKIKKSAHQIVYQAIKKGILVKQPCQICNTTKFICAHHPDYLKPLEVRWLCNLHHYQLHKGILKNAHLLTENGQTETACG